ncbi:Helix-turn-helix domain-containing protein [Halorientalis persicus]|uniref:Helix-turn-helix domain-containing protein n=1 Tax=Halorientalis persicus TaxID=1367881 RepID=A0A1H8VGC6_9EURY|nr:Helix-turn-helix domain-containing protein [Halorientalis persicus]
MNHLDEIVVEELQDALDNVDGKKPTQRLLAAIAYKNGVSQTELAEWYDVQRRTIYNWLKRLDIMSEKTFVGHVRLQSNERRASKRDHVSSPREENR